MGHGLRFPTCVGEVRGGEETSVRPHPHHTYVVGVWWCGGEFPTSRCGWGKR